MNQAPGWETQGINEKEMDGADQSLSEKKRRQSNNVPSHNVKWPWIHFVLMIPSTARASLEIKESRCMHVWLVQSSGGYGAMKDMGAAPDLLSYTSTPDWRIGPHRKKFWEQTAWSSLHKQIGFPGPYLSTPYS
jgi:hypothetical protein